MPPNESVYLSYGQLPEAKTKILKLFKHNDVNSLDEFARMIMIHIVV